MTEKYYLKITTQTGVEKEMQCLDHPKGFIVSDENQNGYYKVAGFGKVKLIEILGGVKPWNDNIQSDEVLAMSKSTHTNCVLRGVGGGIAFALCEILSAEEYEHIKQGSKILKGIK